MQRVYHPEAHSSRQVEARLAYCREGFLNTLHEAAGEVIQHADWLDELVEGHADLSMWLARYVPVEVDDGPEAA